jgi:SNF2 family DNA or RNA helicase
MVFALDKERSRVAFIHGIGSGKTLAALYTALLWGCKKILVVAPNSTIDKTWEPQIKQHTDMSYTLLTGSREARFAKREHDSRIFVINYEGLRVLYARKYRDSKGYYYDMDKKLFTDHFDCVIFDEIHNLKNKGALQTKICHHLSVLADYSIGLTGTIISKSELDMWGEYWCIDLGKSLGTSYFAFRNAFFDEDPWNFKWTLKEGKYNRLLKMVEPVTIRFETEECIDLPEKQYLVRSVPMTTTQRDMTYDVYAERIIETSAGKLEIQDDLHKPMRLLQITGGFINVKNSVGKVVPYRIGSRKYDEIVSCLEECDGKVVIFHQAVEEGRMIEERLSKEGIIYRSLRGEIKNKHREWEQFRKLPEVKCMIAHPRSGGEGIDMYEAHVCIFFSTATSPIWRAQAEGRIWRLGQKHKCTFIDLVVENSVDEVAIERYTTQKEIMEALMAHMRDYKHNFLAKIRNRNVRVPPLKE